MKLTSTFSRLYLHFLEITKSVPKKYEHHSFKLVRPTRAGENAVAAPSKPFSRKTHYRTDKLELHVFTFYHFFKVQ